MTDLYRVLLCFRDGKNLQFCYKSESTSNVAYDSVSVGGLVPFVKIADDYGNKATVNPSDLSAVVHTYVNEDLNSQQDLQILTAHGQVKLNNRIGADPMLKAAMAMQQMNGRAGLA